MAKRKKHPKLPNGYGTIRFLGSDRRNPYAVHPPTTEFNENGIPQTPKAICYVNDWYKGFAVLTAYKAGTYYPGYEKTLPNSFSASDSNFINKILSDYSMTKAADERTLIIEKTFAQVYEEFYKWKFEQDKSKVYSTQAKYSTRAAFKNSSSIHNKIFRNLRHQDLQNVIDDCPLKYSSKELIVSLFHQMYKYADIYELCDKDHSAHVKINIPDDDEHGVPFTDEELSVLWEHKDNPTAELLLILCYTGFRIGELKDLYIDLDQKYFFGGIKTGAGKNRTVPIHSCILDMVIHRLQQYNSLFTHTEQRFRLDMYEFLPSLGIDKHTPHDCRHTFSRLCEKYKVSENDRKRMMGHSFGADITNGIYGHRTVEDLREEIEKIKICD